MATKKIRISDEEFDEMSKNSLAVLKLKMHYEVSSNDDLIKLMYLHIKNLQIFQAGDIPLPDVEFYDHG